MKKIQFLLVLVAMQLQAQQGGMWIPSLLKGTNETEMKQLGMKISAKDIYDANNSSIKDAVPHFDGGCTAEVISDKGLLLTNHHCGFDAIQTHSSIEHNYLQDGFWAYKMTEELPNKDMTVTFIVKIEEVTNQIMEGISATDSETQKQAKIKQNIATVVANFPKENWQENQIKTFFDGNQFLLFVTETFKDIRLVGAPPSSIGKFGSDTDNWVWPRHTGDFSLFRIYADKNNRPAPYSSENVPYTPKHFLPISIKGIQENDFTMVMGYPGRTQEYLPSVAVAQILNTLNPAKIEIRDAALKVQDGFMRKDAAIKIQYASKYARVANYWKKWIGESKGLQKSNAVGIKQQFEKEFLEQAKAANKTDAYGNLFADFETNYTAIEKYALAKDYFNEVALRNTELLSFGFQLYQLEKVYLAKGEQSFLDRKNNLLARFEESYKDFNASVDEKVFEQLLGLYVKKSPFVPENLQNQNIAQLTKEVYSQSALLSFEKTKNILEGTPEEIITKLNNDKGFLTIKALADNYYKEVAPSFDKYNQNITALQRTYMKAILELFPNKRLFPDANSTLRVTYGKVNGYSPADAIYYNPVTYLDGVIEKYVPNDYEFDVPQKLITLYNHKEYGKYADKNGKMPVCFIATNHTTGGNSGSPAIDAKGNLIGLNFDRVWEGTMSDIHYDPEICRNIMVDIRYVLFIIDKYADAQNIIKELHIKK